MNESQQLVQALVAEKVSRIGQLEIERLEGGFVLSHRDDAGRSDLGEHEIDDAFEIAKFDDAGNYRPLKRRRPCGMAGEFSRAIFCNWNR